MRLLEAAVPLILAALGSLFTELAGSLAVFTEGFMEGGAFFSWVLTLWTGSALGGTVLAALGAALSGWLLARFVRVFGANPFIAALALNLAAPGVTGTLSALWFGTKGVLRNPGWKNVVLPGRLTLVLVSWGAVALAAALVSRTVWGLRLRAAGLLPEAARERGLSPAAYREGAWAAAAFLSSLAGAAVSFRVGAYTPGGVAGRGWISLAAVFLGGRTVGGAAAASLVFALAERLGVGAQALGALPATLLLGLPPALALALYSLSCYARRRRGGGRKEEIIGRG